jgi:hypothetical protein
MKHTSIILILLVLLAACKKQERGLADDTGDPDTSLGASDYSMPGLKYSQMSGTFVLTDSIHFIGNPKLQFVHPDSVHTIYKPITITVDSATASFMFEGYKYLETRSTTNEFQTYDPKYTWKKVVFSKDSIWINYFDQDFNPPTQTLNITFKGYRRK